MGDDFVARTDAEGHQAAQQGVGAAGAGEAVFRPDVGGELLFQLDDFGALNVGAVGEDGVEAAPQAARDAGLLFF